MRLLASVVKLGTGPREAAHDESCRGRCGPYVTRGRRSLEESRARQEVSIPGKCEAATGPRWDAHSGRGSGSSLRQGFRDASEREAIAAPIRSPRHSVKQKSATVPSQDLPPPMAPKRMASALSARDEASQHEGFHRWATEAASTRATVSRTPAPNCRGEGAALGFAVGLAGVATGCPSWAASASAAARKKSETFPPNCTLQRPPCKPAGVFCRLQTTGTGSCGRSLVSVGVPSWFCAFRA